MGSRITRSVFREERARPVDRSRAEVIERLTVFFLAFVASLASFLHGYLYRPKQPLHHHLFILAILAWFHTRPKHPKALPIVTSFLLILVILIARLAHLELEGLKTIMILTTLLFLTESHIQIAQMPLVKCALLWFFYASFSAGVSLSAEVLAGGKNEQSMLVKTLFSLIALMGVYLVLIGLRFLDRYRANSQPVRQSSFRLSTPLQVLEMVLLSLLLLASFWSSKNLGQSFGQKLLAMMVSALVIQLANTARIASKIYIVSIILFLSVALLSWASEAEETLEPLIKMVYAVVFNVSLIDGLHNSSVWNSSDNKDRFISTAYFCSFYLATVAEASGLLGGVAIMMQVLALAAYGGLKILREMQTKAEQQAII